MHRACFAATQPSLIAACLVLSVSALQQRQVWHKRQTACATAWLFAMYHALVSAALDIYALHGRYVWGCCTDIELVSYLTLSAPA